MFNARITPNKFQDLEALIALEDYNVIGVSVIARYRKQTLFSLMQYTEYSLFSCERNNSLGGGVILYVKTSLQVTFINK